MESNVVESLEKELLSEGVESKIVPISRWKDVRDEMTEVLDGFTDPGILKYIRTYFDFDIDKSLQNPGSLLIMGVPSPKFRFHFNQDGKEIEVIVPHSYLDPSRTNDRIESILERTLGAGGTQFARLRIPAKLLAVRSGLARYGRNNITYVGNMGSQVRFMIYALDLHVEYQEWHEKRKMDRCNGCDLCLDNCPTGAIDRSRFLLRAEKCLTYFNEEEDEIPEWVDSSSHNCLVGCMICQDVCPENGDVAKEIVEGATFSEEETKALLRAANIEDLPSDLRKKVEDTDLSSLYPVLPRNLGLLLGVRSSNSE
jgi:epoxyqueuosine reductase